MPKLTPEDKLHHQIKSAIAASPLTFHGIGTKLAGEVGQESKAHAKRIGEWVMDCPNSLRFLAQLMDAIGWEIAIAPKHSNTTTGEK